jgi:tRNA(adenine34) deaminase
LGDQGITPDWGSDERWMQLALDEARAAADEGEVPVGCVVVADGRLIGRGHNRVEALQDPTAHAEILAISAAAGTLGSWRLIGVTLFVTAEPCAMCMGAVLQSRVERLVFAVAEPKFGACGSRLDLTRVEGLNHTVRVERGLMAEESSALLRSFFRAARANGRSSGREAP